MNSLTLEEINLALYDFYKTLESNRNAFYGEDKGEEPAHFRNPMVKFLLEHLEDDSVIVDMFSGDLVVPLAVLYLQKKIPELRKLRRIYAVDNDISRDFDLIRRYVQSFGLNSDMVVPVESDVEDASLKDMIEERADVTTVIDSSNYFYNGYVWEPEQFFDNLIALAPVNFTIQVDGINPHYMDDLERKFRIQEGVIERIGKHGIHYLINSAKDASK